MEADERRNWIAVPLDFTHRDVISVREASLLKPCHASVQWSRAAREVGVDTSATLQNGWDQVVSTVTDSKVYVTVGAK